MEGLEIVEGFNFESLDDDSEEVLSILGMGFYVLKIGSNGVEMVVKFFSGFQRVRVVNIDYGLLE